MLATGLPVLIAWIEFGIIIWLARKYRNARQEIIELTLRARRAELRANGYKDSATRWRDDYKQKGTNK